MSGINTHIILITLVIKKIGINPCLTTKPLVCDDVVENEGRRFRRYLGRYIPKVSCIYFVTLNLYF